MFFGLQKIRIFSENGDLASYLQEKQEALKKSIFDESEHYLLNVNEEEYIKYKVDEFKIEPLKLHYEHAYAEHKEELIPAELFPRDFYVISGKSYPKMVIYFHIPVEGELKLLTYTPSTRILWTEEMFLNKSELIFRRIQFRDNVEAINRDYEATVQNLRKMEAYINEDVNNFNNTLRTKIEEIFRGRKQELLKRRNLLSSLVVPIKRSDNVPETFVIPSPGVKKKIAVKPQVFEKRFTPEPALDMQTYKDILKLIHDMGKEFERKPSVYSGKSEEQLRDHFLMLLEPHFEGSATGETFNKNGKTDILLRYEGSNVFIAECKFWRGKGAYLDAISQLLSYLTWRDSKAAIILFVRNKNISDVLKTIEVETPNHGNYLGFVNKEDESWFNYRFHIKGDRNREVKLAVMVYHIPTVH
ncbi:hypothetical protein [Carboxydothermus ferrireducens]|uniref:Restriction endonuclease type IV Mrr domain-containing protein n=1 Tax=Carboxydothermus ferrireducens DSM 11255 TaxID=1119529 RepID=A0ABX2R9F6_9THEO|nr:hypothetical protein [Carboxydothermus ferrireducens]NYE57187.1 hypothetical protein [Carboxydothermus ferrireducens DSM 11255]